MSTLMACPIGSTMCRSRGHRRIEASAESVGQRIGLHGPFRPTVDSDEATFGPRRVRLICVFDQTGGEHQFDVIEQGATPGAPLTEVTAKVDDEPGDMDDRPYLATIERFVGHQNT